MVRIHIDVGEDQIPMSDKKKMVDEERPREYGETPIARMVPPGGTDRPDSGETPEPRIPPPEPDHLIRGETPEPRLPPPRD